MNTDPDIEAAALELWKCCCENHKPDLRIDEVWYIVARKARELFPGVSPEDSKVIKLAEEVAGSFPLVPRRYLTPKFIRALNELDIACAARNAANKPENWCKREHP